MCTSIYGLTQKYFLTKKTLSGSTRQFLGSNQTRPIVTWQIVSYNCRTGILHQCSLLLPSTYLVGQFQWRKIVLCCEVVSFHIVEAHPKSQFMGVLLVQIPTHCQQAQSLQSYTNGLCKSISTQHTTKIFWMKIKKKLAWQAPHNHYDSTFLLNMLRPAKIIAFSKSYFWLVRYIDWSRWFAIRWLWCLTIPVYVFLQRLGTDK
jgi:hypothetical protein